MLSPCFPDVEILPEFTICWSLPDDGGVAIESFEAEVSGGGSGSLGKLGDYPLVNVYIPSGKHTKNYGKSPFFMGQLTISMAIFNSYVKLPEGNYGKSPCY